MTAAAPVAQHPASAIMDPVPAKGQIQSEGVTQLMYACQQADHRKVRSILARKPGSVRERDRTGKTALHYCAENPDPSCMEHLVNVEPAVLNAKDEEGYTPLHLAVISGNKTIVKFLIAKGASLDSLDNEKHSLVHWATVCAEVEALDVLLDAGADPSTPDLHGAYPLHYAAQMCGPNSEMGGDPRVGLLVLRKLLARSVEVNVTDQDGRQPLLWAASAGSPDAMLALVNAGANVEAEDKDGLTALHCAASRGHTDCLETLIALCGAHVDVLDTNGCTALFYSVTLGHADCTQLLLSYGAEPNRQDRKGRTPAHCGAAKGQLETLKLLNKHGANLWMRNVKGDLPLHEAIQSGRKELVRWLLSLRPEVVNAANNDGRTPLHIAAINNNVEMCKILMDLQALVNPVMRNSKGHVMTPLDAALYRGNRGCAKYLQLHGGVPSSKLNDRSSVQQSANSTLPDSLNSSQTSTSLGRGLALVLPSPDAASLSPSPQEGSGQPPGPREPAEGALDPPSSTPAPQASPVPPPSSEPAPVPEEAPAAGPCTCRSSSSQQPPEEEEEARKSSSLSVLKVEEEEEEEEARKSSSLSVLKVEEEEEEEEARKSSSLSVLKVEEEEEEDGRTSGSVVVVEDKVTGEEGRKKQKGSRIPRPLTREEFSSTTTTAPSRATESSQLKDSGFSDAAVRENGDDEEEDDDERQPHQEDTTVDNEEEAEGADEEEEEEEPEDVPEEMSAGVISRRKKERKRARKTAQLLGVDSDSDGTKAVGTSGALRRPRARSKVLLDSQDKGAVVRKERTAKSLDVPSAVSVTQAMQASMRKYYLERRIFQELLELKRLQIRSGRSNEQVLVKRLVDGYKKSGLIVGLRQYDGPYTFRGFEKYLYDQLRLLQNSNRKLIPKFKPSDDLERLSQALKKYNAAEVNGFLPEEAPIQPLLCTHKTHRCHHAAHAYTGIPCAAYIGKHRTGQPSRSANAHNHHHHHHQPFLPKIDPQDRSLVRGSQALEEKSTSNKSLSLQVKRGSVGSSQLISLPTDKLDRDKKYLVTFTIKPSEGGPTDQKGPEKTPGEASPSLKGSARHQHAKSL